MHCVGGEVGWVVGPTPKNLAIISWGPRQNILEKHGGITECNWSIRYSPADSLCDWSPRISVGCDWLVCRVGLWWRCITAASQPRPSSCVVPVVTLETRDYILQDCNNTPSLPGQTTVRRISAAQVRERWQNINRKHQTVSKVSPMRWSWIWLCWTNAVLSFPQSGAFFVMSTGGQARQCQWMDWVKPLLTWLVKLLSLFW